MSSEPVPLVVARDATKRYGSQAAVANLDLEVHRGEILGLIGPSGSGKTTSVRLLTGLASPTAGDVEVFGTPPSRFTPDQRARIGYMPQLSVLYPHLSLQQNLSFVASLYGLPLRGRRQRLRRMLDFVELTPHRRKLLRQTSGGMQRRLALAAALVHEPELLFLDEPTAGLDPVLRRKLWDHFQMLQGTGRTLLLTTQYVGEAAYCDRIAVLRDGTVLTVDTPDTLRRRAYGGELVDLVAASPLSSRVGVELAALPFVLEAEAVDRGGHSWRLLVSEAGAAIPQLQRWLEGQALRVESLHQHVPPFDDVFVKVVQEDVLGA